MPLARIDPETRETPGPLSLGLGGFVVSGCLLRCLSAEAKPVTEVCDSVRVAHVPDVRADLYSPLSLMLGERQTPGVLDSADHSPLNAGVAGRPHLANRLPGFRVIVRVRDKLESVDCRPQGLARSNQASSSSSSSVMDRRLWILASIRLACGLRAAEQAQVGRFAAVRACRSQRVSRRKHRPLPRSTMDKLESVDCRRRALRVATRASRKRERQRAGRHPRRRPPG